MRNTSQHGHGGGGEGRERRERHGGPPQPAMPSPSAYGWMTAGPMPGGPPFGRYPAPPPEPAPSHLSSFRLQQLHYTPPLHRPPPSSSSSSRAPPPQRPPSVSPPHLLAGAPPHPTTSTSSSSSSSTPTATPTTGQARPPTAVRACNLCRVAHTACDVERPCRRCVRMGRAHLCSDVPSRKRGRPIKDKHTPSNGQHNSRDDQLQDDDEDSGPAVPDADEVQITPKKKHKAVAQEPQPSDHVGGLENKIDMLSQMITFMADEMREVRRVNDKLRKKMKVITAEQQGTKTLLASILTRQASPLRAQQASEDESSNERKHSTTSTSTSSASVSVWQPVSSSGLASGTTRLEVPAYVKRMMGMEMPPSSSSDSSSPTSSPPFPAGIPHDIPLVHSGSAVVIEAKKQMPFLAPYDITGRFAISDFSRPVCVYLTPSIFEETTPAMAYANPAFLRLTGYVWNELLGSPYPMVFAVHEHQYRALAPIMINRPPLSVSDVYQVAPLIRCKSGRLLRANENVQFFYDHNGNTRFTMVCLRDWADGRLEEGERHGFDQWVPILNVLPPLPASQGDASRFQVQEVRSAAAAAADRFNSYLPSAPDFHGGGVAYHASEPPSYASYSSSLSSTSPSSSSSSASSLSGYPVAMPVDVTFPPSSSSSSSISSSSGSPPDTSSVPDPSAPLRTPEIDFFLSSTEGNSFSW